LASLAVLIWLLLCGDVIGYVTFHIAFNQTAYAPFIDLSFAHFLRSVTPSLGSLKIVNTLGVAICLLSCLLFLKFHSHTHPSWRRCLSIVLGHIGVLLLNLRGMTTFQDGTFLIAAFGLFSVATARALVHVNRTGDWNTIVGTLVVIFCITASETVARHAMSTPVTMVRAEILSQPQSRIAQHLNIPVLLNLRQVIGANERVLALPFWPDFYWNLDRLPMDGFYEYLPWDAAYARSPWFGRIRDLCVTLKHAPPPLIALQDAPVWGRFSIWQYAPCIRELLTSSYDALPGYPFLYVRHDRFLLAESLTSESKLSEPQ
jgi:hypothetical protein